MAHNLNKTYSRNFFNNSFFSIMNRMKLFFKKMKIFPNDSLVFIITLFFPKNWWHFFLLFFLIFLLFRPLKAEPQTLPTRPPFPCSVIFPRHPRCMVSPPTAPKKKDFWGFSPPPYPWRKCREEKNYLFKKY